MFDVLKYINKNSQYVKVNMVFLKEYANEDQNWEYHYWLSDLKKKLSERECIIFSFLCESINFCFWENEKYSKDYIGSATIFNQMSKTSLKDPRILSVQYMSNINRNEFNKLFGGSSKEIPLMRQRYKLFKETAQNILAKKESFWDEIFSFRRDVDLLDYLTENFNAFKDESYYLGRQIKFNKKATLLANDLFWLSDRMREKLGDLDNLTGCADYAVPRFLLEKHILEYNDELSKLIKYKKIIPHNSPMEVEIRANTLYVIEMMRKILCDKGVQINSVQLDNVLWRGRNKIKHSIPVHRTRTICY